MDVTFARKNQPKIINSFPDAFALKCIVNQKGGWRFLLFHREMVFFAKTV